jgi:quercetin 2,3-dioxygenase
MLRVRRADDRGRTKLGWLDSRHTFSFGGYLDSEHMGFRTLRVLNDDRVAPGQGFGRHHHRDMEILSYVLAGELAHQDSLGNGSVVRPGEVQRMTAGRGVEHSERNPSPDAEVHFLQVWVLPAERGLAPGYEQRAFPEAERRDRLRLVASQDGREGSVTVHQDADVYLSLVSPGARIAFGLRPGRGAWLHVARGALSVDGVTLSAGDGASTDGARELTLEGLDDAELLLFDLG